ncbi:MAG: Maf family protein [Eubacteriales bacterium]|nr:Maf family protein [Eubacteriales bacterium]MDD4121520.1 Maf family protein [Eubacteriales bacterium]MDD4629729.1 Maf family protein [Eubacteriales bacterium]
MNSHIILASSSPRRIEMLKENGIEPVIIPSSADEILPLDINMEQSVMYLALKKALHVEKMLLDHTPDFSNASVIIAADTIVYKGHMIGKPTDENDAENILKLLRNTSHYVATGVALVRPGSTKRTVIYDVTEVFFRNYSDDEISNYIRTKEPWDKAGGYAIQGAWGKHVSHIIGNYDNVMGFPWVKIKSELEKNWPEVCQSFA